MGTDLTVGEAARRLGLSARAVVKMCSAGKLLGARKVAGKWSIPISADSRFRSQPGSAPAPGCPDVNPRKLKGAVAREQMIAAAEKFCGAAVRAGSNRSDALAAFCAREDVPLSTLRRWMQLYAAGGIEALVDRRGGSVAAAEVISAEAFEYLKDLYLHPAQRTLKQCLAVLRYVNEVERRGWVIPEYPALVRYCQKHIPEAAVVLWRKGQAAYDAQCAPHIEVDYSSVEPGHTWCGDHHQCNCLVRYKGKWVRPWITAWLDLGSRMIVGRCVSVSPNSTTILNATRQGVKGYGPPARVKIDNGRDYDAEMFIGTTKKRRRAGGEEQYPGGIYNLLDIEVSFAIPYHPQAKAIERFFDRLDCEFTKWLPTYCGKNTAQKPEDLARKLKSEEGPDLKEFTCLLDQWLAKYNAAPHTALGGRSPAEVMAGRTTRRALKEGVAELLLRVWSGVLKIGKNGIRFRGLRYGQYDPVLLNNYGRLVRVSADPNDMREVYVYDAQTMELLCVAEQNQLVAYGDVTDEAVREGMRAKARALRDMRAVRESRVAQVADLATLAIRAQAEADAPKQRRERPALRAVATPLDSQTGKGGKRQARAAEKLGIDLSRLRPPQPEKKPLLNLFGQGA